MKRSLDVFKLFGKIIIDHEQASSDLEKIGEKASGLAGTIGKMATAFGKATIAAVGVASTAVVGLTKTAIQGYSEYEQLVGGMEKIFSDMDVSRIEADASQAYKTMGMSASEYLAIINDVGASFSATMGDEAGYEAAKNGLQAISDYASGTGKNFGDLQQKLALITRSTSSYQSIADQFSGILPATSEGFLKAAQSAGVLSTSYKKLTDVPIAEYQKAVTDMLAEGVDALNLTGNTATEAATTLSGSVTAMKSAWRNLVTGIADDNADMKVLIGNFVETLVGDGSGKGGVINNILPKVEQSLDGMGKMVDTMMPIIVDKVPTIINEWLPKILESGMSMVQTIANGILQNSGEITSGAVNTIMTFVNGIVENLPEILVSAVTLMGQFAAGLSQALPDVIAKVPELVSGIFNAFAENAGTFAEIGTAIVEGIAGGIAAMWDSLVEYCSGLISGLVAGMGFTITGNIVVPDFNVGVNGSAGSTGGTGGPTGSTAGGKFGGGTAVKGFATGLDYVPYDEFPAYLHRGEAVLTASEASVWRNGGSDAATAQNEKIIELLTATVSAIVGSNEELLQALMSDRTIKVGEREFARLVKQYA